VENVEVEADDGDPVGLLRWIHEQREAAVLATVLAGSDQLPVGRRFALTASGHRLGADGAGLWSAVRRAAQQALRARRSLRERIVVSGA
ncbi:MAG: XdhC family protein, partial [Nannocystaceae bacterium]